MAEVVSAQAFGCIGIVGVGLIGGSIALATRRVLPGARLIGFEPSPSVDLTKVVDLRANTLEELATADVIFACVPVADMPAMLEELGRVAASALITDVCSTKRVSMAAAANARLQSFIGGHPMAGSERPGLESARADLFEGRPWLLVRGSATAQQEQALEHFVRGLGSAPQWMGADEHDRTVAYVSHLPQIVATALMNAAEQGSPANGPLAAGNAFGEMTRLASSPASMWSSVFRDNADFVAEALDAFLGQLPRTSGAADDWVREALARSGEARARWRAARSRKG